VRFEETVHVGKTPAEIFALYQDVNNWPTWDPEIITSSIDGPFKTGMTGFLKPRSGPKSKFTLTEVVQDKSFTARTKLPLCSMYFEHELVPEPSGTKVLHRIVFKGFLAPVFGRLIGKKLHKELSHTMQSLKQEVEHKKL
jgi:carbon monoxide dehydrogenase subunit G